VTSEEPSTAPDAGKNTSKAADPYAGTIGGFKIKNLVIIGVVTLAIWAFSIQTGSVIMMSITGVLTVLLLAVMVWAFRMVRKQKGLSNLLQGAVASPEARREALAKLEAGKDAGQVTNVFARAQLLAADDPAGALVLIEKVDLKNVPAQMQDDVALLRSQLYLHFGRPRDARPFVDKINVDNPQRAQARAMMVWIVSEAWARTGKHQDALTLIETVNLAKEEPQLRGQLMAARIFARFASGKKAAAREDLEALAALDINQLGKFLMPQFKVHPELQKLARAVAEKNPQMRKMAKAQTPRQRRPRG